MKKIIGLAAILFAISSATFAQENESNEHINVPAKVKTALMQKYPEAKKLDGKRKMEIMKQTGEENPEKIIRFNLRLQVAL